MVRLNLFLYRRYLVMKSDILWWRAGILVAIIAVILNLTTMLFKAAHLIRGDLTSDALEMALLIVCAIHGLITVGQGYLLFYCHKQIREAKGG